MKEPKKEDYGYCPNEGFDSEMGGFVVEGGEEAYYEALEKYKFHKEGESGCPVCGGSGTII